MNLYHSTIEKALDIADEIVERVRAAEEAAARLEFDLAASPMRESLQLINRISSAR